MGFEKVGPAQIGCSDLHGLLIDSEQERAEMHEQKGVLRGKRYSLIINLKCILTGSWLSKVKLYIYCIKYINNRVGGKYSDTP